MFCGKAAEEGPWAWIWLPGFQASQSHLFSTYCVSGPSP